MDRMVEETVVEDVAQVCHEANRAYCKTLGDNSQPSWEEAPDWQKKTVIEGVHKIVDNPNLTPEESHQEWMNKKLEDGWALGKEKDSELKIHPNLVPYNKLPESEKDKDVLFIAVAKALLPTVQKEE